MLFDLEPCCIPFAVKIVQFCAKMRRFDSKRESHILQAFTKRYVKRSAVSWLSAFALLTVFKILVGRVSTEVRTKL